MKKTIHITSSITLIGGSMEDDWRMMPSCCRNDLFESEWIEVEVIMFFCLLCIYTRESFANEFFKDILHILD